MFNRVDCGGRVLRVEDKRLNVGGIEEFLVRYQATEARTRVAWLSYDQIIAQNSGRLFLCYQKFTFWYVESRFGKLREATPYVDIQPHSYNWAMKRQINYAYLYEQSPPHSCGYLLKGEIDRLIAGRIFCFELGFQNSGLLDRKIVELIVFRGILKLWLPLIQDKNYVIGSHFIGRCNRYVGCNEELDLLIKRVGRHLNGFGYLSLSNSTIGMDDSGLLKTLNTTGLQDKYTILFCAEEHSCIIGFKTVVIVQERVQAWVFVPLDPEMLYGFSRVHTTNVVKRFKNLANKDPQYIFDRDTKVDSLFRCLAFVSKFFDHSSIDDIKYLYHSNVLNV